MTQHPIQSYRKLSFFDRSMAHEKGSREWNAFRAVEEDHTTAYRVAQPTKPMAVRGPHHLLRIIYPEPRHHLRPAH